MDAGRWPLVGRDAERAEIAGVLASDSARSIVVVGPAGVGRTRLVREALQLAHQRGHLTRWAAGTAAAAAVPLGALAHLLPAVDGASDALMLLQAARSALMGDGSGPAPVLAIDDIHLLDPLSITLLYQLAASHAVTLMLTVRTSPATPDPVAALWKDELATRIELQPLHREETAALVDHALGGVVDSRTDERLWQLTRGNPLFLRELLDDARRSGRLHSSDGLWRWDGPMIPSQRLTEIVLAQLGPMTSDEWRALEVLATAEPLSAPRLARLSSAEAVASLQRRGVITDVSPRLGEVGAAHPLYTAVVRTRMPEAAIRDIRRLLAGGDDWTGSPAGLVRRGLALIDGDVPDPDEALFTAAAECALAMMDFPAAERLALRGIEGGEGIRAERALIEAVRCQGRAAGGGNPALDEVRSDGSDEERAMLPSSRALTLFCSSGHADEAAAVLTRVAAVARSEEGRAVVVATQATVAFLSGDPWRAVTLAKSVLDSDGRGGAAEPLATAAAAAGLAVTGYAPRALTLTAAGWEMLEPLSHGHELTFARLILAHAEMVALHTSGRLHELDLRAGELHRRALQAPDGVGDAIACLHLGCAALARGRVRAAVRWLMEADAGLRRRDPVGMRRFARSQLAVAKALAGDTAGARQLVAHLDAEGPPTTMVFEPMVEFAAGCAAADGSTAEAGARVLRAARLAAAQGQDAVEAVILHGALRLGRSADVAHRLGELAEHHDAPLLNVLHAHARAAVHGSGPDLDRISRRFEEIGALPLAADAAAEAGAAFGAAGDRRAAAAARARAVTLVRECGLSGSPVLSVLLPPPLTSREEEVARLAVQGLSNQAIADELVVSVRTVEAHLAHAYTKLGITGRADLAAALGDPMPGAVREGFGWTALAVPAPRVEQERVR